DLNTMTTDLRSIELVNGILLVGGQGGVFRTLDPSFPSPFWNKVGENMPNAIVTSLHYDPTDNVLVAGTFGRGAWKLEDAANVLGTPNNLRVLGNPGQISDFHLQRDRDNPTMLDVSVNGHTSLVPFATLNFITFDGGSGTNASLTLSYLFGDPVPAGLGVNLIGGTGQNSLTIIANGNSGSYVPAPTVTGDGTLGIDCRYISVQPGTLENPGSQSLTLLGHTTNFTFTTPNDGDEITIGSGVENEISGSSGGVHFTPLEFTDIANLTIDAASRQSSSTAPDH